MSVQILYNYYNNYINLHFFNLTNIDNFGN